MSDPCADGHEIETWRGRDICVTCGYTDTPGMKEPPMEHDPQCIATNKQSISATICTYCQLIRKVRAEYEFPDIQGHPV